MKVLYFVYCVAEDDEATDGCFQRNATESPDCGNNEVGFAQSTDLVARALLAGSADPHGTTWPVRKPRFCSVPTITRFSLGQVFPGSDPADSSCAGRCVLHTGKLYFASSVFTSPTLLCRILFESLPR